jgi:hypothetical protein
MPAIRPHTKQKHLVHHITRLFRENNDTLFAYAAMMGESTEYVLNELVATVLPETATFSVARRTSRSACAAPRRPTRASHRDSSRITRKLHGTSPRRRNTHDATGTQMMRRALEFRTPINVSLAVLVGVVGLRVLPFPSDNLFSPPWARESPGCSRGWRTLPPESLPHHGWTARAQSWLWQVYAGPMALRAQFQVTVPTTPTTSSGRLRPLMLNERGKTHTILREQLL